VLTPETMARLAAELTDATAEGDAESLAAIAWQLYGEAGENLAEIDRLHAAIHAAWSRPQGNPPPAPAAARARPLAQAPPTGHPPRSEPPQAPPPAQAPVPRSPPAGGRAAHWPSMRLAGCELGAASFHISGRMGTVPGRLAMSGSSYRRGPVGNRGQHHP